MITAAALTETAELSSSRYQPSFVLKSAPPPPPPPDARQNEVSGIQRLATVYDFDYSVESVLGGLVVGQRYYQLLSDQPVTAPSGTRQTAGQKQT